MALASASPTVVVKAGLIDEALTIVRLSPVARTESPRRVLRKKKRDAETAAVIRSESRNFPQGRSVSGRAAAKRV